MGKSRWDGQVSSKPARRAIRSYISSLAPGEPVAVHEVADELEMSQTTARTHLNDMADEGLLTKKQRGARWVSYWNPVEVGECPECGATLTAEAQEVDPP